VYVPGTHSKYGFPVVKLAFTTPLAGTVRDVL